MVFPGGRSAGTRWEDGQMQLFGPTMPKRDPWDCHVGLPRNGQGVVVPGGSFWVGTCASPIGDTSKAHQHPPNSSSRPRENKRQRRITKNRRRDDVATRGRSMVSGSGSSGDYNPIWIHIPSQKASLDPPGAYIRVSNTSPQKVCGSIGSKSSTMGDKTSRVLPWVQSTLGHFSFRF